MNKSAAFLLSIVGIIILLLGAAFAWTNFRKDHSSSGSEPDTGSFNTDTQKFAEVPMLSDTLIKTSDPTQHYSIEVHYPKVSIVGHPDLAKEADSVILSFVNDQIKEFKDNVNELYSPSVPKEFESDFTMHYNPLLLSPTIISLRFDYSEYIAGAAHPNNQSRVLNYDIKRHLLLSTDDLFASSTTALPFLSKKTRAVLTQMMANEPKDIVQSQMIPGTDPTHENFQEVALTKKGLLVIFNPYQVAPYARGTILVPIPLAETEGLLATPTLEAIDLATSNIVEATLENAGTSSPE